MSTPIDLAAFRARFRLLSVTLAALGEKNQFGEALDLLANTEKDISK